MIPAVRELADTRCQRVTEKHFTPDPGLSEFAAKISASVRSFHAGDAAVLAQCVIEQLKTAPHLTVYGECVVHLPDKAFRLAGEGQHLSAARVSYTGIGRRRVIDLVVYDKRTGKISFYEIKRGTDTLGADQRRQRLIDDAVLRLVGVDYARRRLGLPAVSAVAGTISYYGLSGLPTESTLFGEQLDVAFDWPVQSEVETHLTYFRRICEQSVPGLTAEADW